MNTTTNLMNFDCIYRVECSGETRYISELRRIAESCGAKFVGGESGQFAHQANPSYRIHASASAAFVSALKSAGYHFGLKTADAA